VLCNPQSAELLFLHLMRNLLLKLVIPAFAGMRFGVLSYTA
jgi:hypothetical protein